MPAPAFCKEPECHSKDLNMFGSKMCRRATGITGSIWMPSTAQPLATKCHKPTSRHRKNAFDIGAVAAVASCIQFFFRVFRISSQNGARLNRQTKFDAVPRAPTWCPPQWVEPAGSEPIRGMRIRNGWDFRDDTFASESDGQKGNFWASCGWMAVGRHDLATGANVPQSYGFVSAQSMKRTVTSLRPRFQNMSPEWICAQSWFYKKRPKPKPIMSNKSLDNELVGSMSQELGIDVHGDHLL